MHMVEELFYHKLKMLYYMLVIYIMVHHKHRRVKHSVYNNGYTMQVIIYTL